MDIGSSLMLEFQQGNEEAFNKIVKLYSEDLINFLYHLSWDRQMAEDIAQETFIKVYNSRESYSPSGSFKSFLFRIAKNLWIDYLRKKKAKEISLEDAKEELRLKDILESKSKTPLQLLTIKELAQKISKAINILPESQRLVFVMAQIEGMKYSEIANVLDIPEGTVKSRMFFAISKLREILEEI